MRVIGLDSGSTTTKGVLFEEGRLLKKSLLPTAGDPKNAMLAVLKQLDNDFAEQLLTPEAALFTSNVTDPDTTTLPYLVTTGYGRKLLPADLVVTEITCHGKGSEYLRAGTEQVIDIGGQDCKAILLNGQGGVAEFSMNDRCAAGTGRFVEVMMRTLGEEIGVLDTFVATAVPVTINSMCTVFAESEVVSLIAKGAKREDIALGVLQAIAKRINGQYSKLRPKKGAPVFFTGGLSASRAFTAVLAETLGAPVVTDPLSQYAGAIGAAQIGIKKAESRRISAPLLQN